MLVGMRPAEALAMVAGVSLLGFAAIQATFGRPPEAFLIAGVALIVVSVFGRQMRRFGFGPSGVTIEAAAEVAEQVLDKDQAPDLKLAISTGIPIGAAEVMMDSSHVVQITAVNTSERPIGLNTLGLELEDGRWVPFLHNAPYDSQVKIPGILQPQQSATVYNDHDGLIASLRDEHGKVRRLVANLADGTKREADLPPGWETLTG